MAISFDWYENPVSPDKPEEKRFHPRIIANGQIDTKDLRSRIQSRCTLNEVDVTAVLDALSQVMGEELCEGRQVHLDGIGYFYPTLTATEEIAAAQIRCFCLFARRIIFLFQLTFSVRHFV